MDWFDLDLDLGLLDALLDYDSHVDSARLHTRSSPICTVHVHVSRMTTDHAIEIASCARLFLLWPGQAAPPVPCCQPGNPIALRPRLHPSPHNHRRN